MEYVFVLRAELRGHEADVRGVACIDPSRLVTASRDKTVRTWTAVPDQPGFAPEHTLAGHTDFVSAVLAAPPGLLAEFPTGALVSTGRDARVLVWELPSGVLRWELKGHTLQVFALAMVLDAPGGAVVASASVDGTVRLWRAGAEVGCLQHGQPVLALLAAPGGGLLTGGQDGTVRLWREGSVVATLKGHTDTVRALAELPGVGPLSGSHDCSVRLWTWQGECLSELVGHTALVFTVAGAVSGLIASGSEDNTARLWRADGSCLAVLAHPGCVWATAFLPAAQGSGGGSPQDWDLVTGCEDAAARVWTAAPTRAAPAELTAALADKLTARAAAKAASEAESNGSGVAAAGIKAEDPSALRRPGATNGAIKVIKESDGKLMAYSWDGPASTWSQIGEVTGTAGAGGGRKEHLGVTYDYVFDVDVEEGSPPRRLRYNLGENPYDAADRFLEENSLPGSYREQVVKFIIASTDNKAAASLPPVGASCDPFTGGSAYVPGGATSAVTSVTNGGGWVGSADPFTGGGAYTPTEKAPPRGVQTARTLVYVPKKGPAAAFDPPHPAPLGRKLREFNDGPLAGTPHALSSASLDALLLPLLESRPADAFADPSQVASMVILLGWPAAHLFPALDLVRAAVAHPAAAARVAANPEATRAAIGAIKRAADPPASAANLQTATRLLAAAFAHPLLADALALQPREALIEALVGPCCAPAAPPAARLGLATVLLNYAASDAAARVPTGSERALQVLSACAEMLPLCPPTDPEPLFRLLVAVATLAHADPQLRGLVKDMGVDANARAALKTPGKVADAASDLLQVLA